MNRSWMMLLLLPWVGACGSVLDIPPDATKRFTFESIDRWQDVGNLQDASYKTVTVSAASIGGRKVLHGTIPFDGTGQIAEVQYMFAPLIHLTGKTMRASISVAGLSTALATYPARIGLFAKDQNFSSTIADENLTSAGTDDWHSYSFSFGNTFPNGVSAIGVYLATNPAGTWMSADLYIDTVEIR